MRLKKCRKSKELGGERRRRMGPESGETSKRKITGSRYKPGANKLLLGQKV